MDTPEYTVINPEEPLYTDGLFDVLVTDENGDYVYGSDGKVQALRYIIKGNRKITQRVRDDIISTVESYADHVFLSKSNISQELSSSTTTVPSSNVLKQVYDYTIGHTNFVSQSNDGILTSADKIKLDGISNSANSTLYNGLYSDGATIGTLIIDGENTNIVIPISGEDFGIVKIGENIENDKGTIFVKTATLNNKGVVQLSSEITDSNDLAATSNAVKQVYDYAKEHFDIANANIDTSGTTVTTTHNNAQKAYLVGSISNETNINDNSLIKDEDVYLTSDNGRLYAKQLQSDTSYAKTINVPDDIIDVSSGTVFIKNVSKNVYFDFVGALEASCFSLILKNGGKYNVVWPENVSWSSGYAPDLSYDGTDILMFMSPDGGNNWYGFKSSMATR